MLHFLTADSFDSAALFGGIIFNKQLFNIVEGFLLVCFLTQLNLQIKNKCYEHIKQGISSFKFGYLQYLQSILYDLNVNLH